jgi:hypothetical protein
MVKLLKEVCEVPVSGLVITLSEKDEERRAALSALQNESQIEVGEGAGRRLPIVVDTPSSIEDRRIWEWLHSLPGVRFVDVACVHFDDESVLEHQTEAAS